jgi:hypothetical protein
MTRRTAAASVLAVLLMACSNGKRTAVPTTTTTTLPPSPFASTSASGTQSSTSNAGGVPRGSLAVGDCFNASRFTPGTPIDPADIALALCVGEHQHEVYLVIDYPAPKDTSYPGPETLAAFADDRCIAAFEPYVGTQYLQSTLDYGIVHPSERSWKDGDRQVACVLHHIDFTLLVGTMRASGK